MKLRNVTQKKHFDCRVYASDWQKGIGLMFRLRAPSFAVIFPFARPQRVPIHMFFVFFSLDIAWLDADGRVLFVRRMRPWTYHNPEVLCSYVVELPAGSGVRVNDRLSIPE